MLIQLLTNGLIAGCGYALVALGFSLIYNTTRVFHFAHGAVYALAGYIFYTSHKVLGLPLPIALLITILVAATVGVLVDLIVYLPLVSRGTSSLILMMSSLGLYIVGVNLISAFYGNSDKVLRSGAQTMHSLGSVTITSLQLSTIVIAAVLFPLLALILKVTRLGRIIRAMRDDAELLSVTGSSPRTVRLIIFALGSGLAAVSAVITAIDVGITPHMGMSTILISLVALIVGGVRAFEGAALGAVLLGLVQHLAVWQIPVGWGDTITFLVLILFLLFRPEGILGGRGRVEEVAI